MTCIKSIKSGLKASLHVHNELKLMNRKYGFHGVSYSFILNTVAKKYSKRIEDVNMIVLHLGSGCSACVIKGGQSIDTSMGFTPLEGWNE
jgi:acetate kinase